MITMALNHKAGLFSGLLDWLVNNSLAVTIIVLVLLALLLLGVALYLFRRSGQPYPFSRTPLNRNSRRRKAANKKKLVSGWALVDISGQDIALKPLPFNIGREAGNALVLDDLSVSPRHARIYYDAAFGGLVIEDLDTPSGILVEDQPTRKNLLQSGMQLTIGRYTFKLIHQSA